MSLLFYFICHIGVFLNDETGTLTATLFSPDAEKLTKFTGAEIQEAAARNAPLNDEIERMINKKPVICFVKQLEKTFRGNAETSYPIVKLYTEEEIAPSKTPKIIEAGSSSPAVDSSAPTSQIDGTETQFFSPNTKLTIEEIGNETGIVGTGSAASSSPKRTLLFTDVSNDKLDAVLPPPSPSSADAENTSSTCSGIHESPGKKVKGKETENI